MIKKTATDLFLLAVFAGLLALPIATFGLTVVEEESSDVLSSCSEREASSGDGQQVDDSKYYESPNYHRREQRFIRQ